MVAAVEDGSMRDPTVHPMWWRKPRGLTSHEVSKVDATELSPKADPRAVMSGSSSQLVELVLDRVLAVVE